MSSAGGNMTKSNMTNTTSGATKNMTGPVMGGSWGFSWWSKEYDGQVSSIS